MPEPKRLGEAVEENVRRHRAPEKPTQYIRRPETARLANRPPGCVAPPDVGITVRAVSPLVTSPSDADSTSKGWRRHEMRMAPIHRGHLAVVPPVLAAGATS